MIMIRDHDHHHGDEEDINVLSCTTNYTALIAKTLDTTTQHFYIKLFTFFT